jgi:hypothetical protein
MKEKIYCSECEFNGGRNSNKELCNYTDNIEIVVYEDWYSTHKRTGWYNKASTINKKNDCKWFEEIEKVDPSKSVKYIK